MSDKPSKKHHKKPKAKAPSDGEHKHSHSNKTQVEGMQNQELKRTKKTKKAKKGQKKDEIKGGTHPIVHPHKHQPEKGYRLTLKKHLQIPKTHQLDLKKHIKAHKIKLPSKVDLSPVCGPVLNQENLSDCASFSLTQTAEFLLRKEQETAYDLSELFTYYVTRVKILGEAPTEDNGSSLLDVVAALKTYGVSQNALWPYDTNNFSSEPSPAAFNDAATHKLTKFAPLAQNLPSIRAMLAGGYVVNVGIAVYSNFMNPDPNTGYISLPGPEDNLIGYHAVIISAYDDKAKKFTLKNQWGPDWAVHGYFQLDYAYILSSQLCISLLVLTEFQNL